MQNRGVSTTDDVYNDSPGYHFCKELIKINEHINQFAKDQKFIEASQEMFNDAYSKLEPKMYAEEDSRPHLKLPASLCYHIDNHEEEKRQLSQQLEKLEQEYKLRKEELSRRKEDLSNTLQIEITKNTAQLVIDEKNYIDAFNPLNTEVQKLEQQYKLKEQEIDSKCCSCTATKERKELASIKAQKELVYEKITRLQKEKSEHPINITIKKLEEERSKLINELTKLINIDYPAQYNQAQKVLDEAIVEYKELKAIYDNKIQQHYSKISKETLLLYARAYVCYLQVKDKVEEFWAEQYKISKGKIGNDDPIFILKDKLNAPKEKLDLLIKTLNCPDCGCAKIIDIYKRFLCLNSEDKIKFLKGNIGVSIEKILLPINNAITLFAKDDKDAAKSNNHKNSLTINLA